MSVYLNGQILFNFIFNPSKSPIVYITIQEPVTTYYTNFEGRILPIFVCI